MTNVLTADLNIVVADRDRGCWFTRTKDGLESLSTEEFLTPDRFSKYDLLVVEAAHVIPRTFPPKSKAQIYSSEQLDGWKPGCSIRTVKELHAKRRRDLFGIDTKKTGGDADALYLYIQSLENFSLVLDSTRKFPFKPIQSWLVDIIENMNVRQNTARVLDYQNEESLRVLSLFEGLVDPTLNVFRGSTLKNKPEALSKAKIAPAYIMAVYTALFDSEGNIRVDDKGRQISIKTVKRLLGMSGDAPRSVARGKIQHDLYGSGLGKASGHSRAAYAKSDEYKEYRSRCELGLLHLISLVKNVK